MSPPAMPRMLPRPLPCPPWNGGDGDTVTVYYNGVMTRSIPPQVTALEVLCCPSELKPVSGAGAHCAAPLFYVTIRNRSTAF